MTTAQDQARGVRVGPYEFDHPKMIEARRLWAELLRRDGELAPGDEELAVYMHIDPIRDRLVADVLNPYAWDKEEYDDLFRGGLEPDGAMIDRMIAATKACRNLGAITPEEDHAPQLMIAAMFQWYTLNPEVAAVGARLALRIDPACEVASLLISMAATGIRPKWAQR